MATTDYFIVMVFNSSNDTLGYLIIALLGFIMLIRLINLRVGELRSKII